MKSFFKNLSVLLSFNKNIFQVILTLMTISLSTFAANPSATIELSPFYISVKKQFNLASFSDEPIVANPDGKASIEILNSKTILISYRTENKELIQKRIHLNFNELISGAPSNDSLEIFLKAQKLGLSMIINTLISFSKAEKPIVFSLNTKAPGFVSSDYNMNEVQILPFNQNLGELILNTLVAQEESIRQQARKMEKNSPSKIGFLANLGTNPKKHSTCKSYYF